MHITCSFCYITQDQNSESSDRWLILGGDVNACPACRQRVYDEKTTFARVRFGAYAGSRAHPGTVDTVQHLPGDNAVTIQHAGISASIDETAGLVALSVNGTNILVTTEQIPKLRHAIDLICESLQGDHPGIVDFAGLPACP